MSEFPALDDIGDIVVSEQQPQPSPQRQASPRRLAASRLVAVGDFVADAIPSQSEFDELDLDYDPGARALWCYMRPKGVPSFTPSMLGNLTRLHAELSRQDLPANMGRPLYFVGGSRFPGVFNLGGDLEFFLARIKSGDAPGLRAYARACVHAVYSNSTGFDAPVVTICLLEGNALGGGLEAALSFHVLVAERGLKFGFPEVLFGSFPGMGAYSFLSRRLGMRDAEKLISSGRIYSSEEFHEMGLVDILAGKGEGAAAVRTYMAQNRSRHGLTCAHHKIRRRLNPLTLAELYDITDIWVEAALSLGAGDLRRMERLLAAQSKQTAAQATAAAPA